MGLAMVVAPVPPGDCARSARELLGRICPTVANLDVTAFDETELRSTLALVREVQRSLDGLVIRIAARANVLAGKGAAAPAAETARGGGTVSSRQAKREAARADVATAIPVVGRAASAGLLSGEHVDAIARHTAGLTPDQRERLDHAVLVDKATSLPVETFERLLRRQISQMIDDGGLGETVAKQKASELRHWVDRESGMGKIFATLDPELYEQITGAIERQVSAMATSAGETKDPNLSARALGALVVRTGGSRPASPAVTVLVDHATLVGGPHTATVCQTESGHDIAVASVQRLCCDATLRSVVLDKNRLPLAVGRARRTATDAQWAAIKAMHSTCAWSGCQAPIGWCQAHHIREWEHGGRTDFDNLVPLCSRHHHRVHEGRWRVVMATDRSLQLFRPDGVQHDTVPTPARC